MRPSRWCVPQLVNPFLDRNVGSVARSMLNFGLQDLVLVDPQCDHLSQDAITLAAGAESLLRQAFVVSEVRSSLPAAHSPAASHFTAPSLSRDRPRVCTHARQQEERTKKLPKNHAQNPGCQMPARGAQPPPVRRFTRRAQPSHSLLFSLSLPPLPFPSPSPLSFLLFHAQVSAAIEDAEVVVAVTARARKFAPPSIYPRDLESIVASLARERERCGELVERGDAGDSGVGGAGWAGRAGTGGALAGVGHGGKGGLAVMFGSERNGLTSGMPVIVGLLYLYTRGIGLFCLYTRSLLTLVHISDQLSTANYLLHIPSFPGFGCV